MVGTPLTAIFLPGVPPLTNIRTTD